MKGPSWILYSFFKIDILFMVLFPLLSDKSNSVYRFNLKDSDTHIFREKIKNFMSQTLKIFMYQRFRI